jgi:acyl dehydratase
MPTEPVDWHVVARNLPEHARNPIHTDAGAQAAGFPRALVAGVTTYGYLTQPLITAWGLDWVAGGGGEVRFRRPVFDGDLVRCAVSREGDAVVVGAVTDGPEQPRAVFRALPNGGPLPPMREGQPLITRELELTGEWGAEHSPGSGITHPAMWPMLANQIVHTQVARGSWIHTRSIVRHHDLARVGCVAVVRSTVVNRFQSHGERAVLDVVIEVDGVPVASIEHEAIVALPATS